MPHTSKKYKKQNATPKGPNRMIIYAVIGVVAIIAIAGGYFVLSSAHSITSSTASVSNASSASTSVGSTNPSTSVTATGNLVYATFDTSQGTFVAELFANDTPRTVANFVSLAESGFYNNLVWHRIQAGFVIQTGDPTSRNGGGSPCTWGQTSDPNVSIPFEDSPYLHNTVGTLGMASTGAKVAGQSQFYINLADNSASLDGSYTVFGQVISGMSVVNAIGNLPISSACGNSGTGGPPENPSQAMLISVTISNTPPS
jgi:cyclophilin family peptidyl-prolyl cis-trans isomerase